MSTGRLNNIENQNATALDYLTPVPIGTARARTNH